MKIRYLIKRKLLFGWNENISELKGEERVYYGKRDELSLESNCILWGLRVVIPKKLREPILQQLHESHFGIVKMKQIARSFFWWPGLDTEIEKLVDSCELCVKNRVKLNKVSTMQWPYPSEPWSRIHTDFLGPFYGHMLIVIIDAHSKWPEVINMKNNTTSKKTIEVFDSVFARFGLCNHLVSDNGPQNTSDEYKEYIKALSPSNKWGS